MSTRTRTDFTPDSGCVLPCKLCSHRAVADTSREAWSALRRHLIDHHHSPHAGRLAEQARKSISRYA